MGKVPALEHGGVVITEVGAICMYLADAFASAGLAPAIGDPQRGPYLRWMFFQGNCLEPALIDKAMKREPGPASTMPYGDLDTTIATLEGFVGRASPWLLGSRFSALDVYLGSAIRWTMRFGLLPELPAFTSYAARLAERPASRRAEARDAALAANGQR
jgi:glutathione S-transferase